MRLDAVAKQRPGAAAGPVCQPARDRGRMGGGEEGAAGRGAIRVRGCTACRGTNARSQGSNYRHRIMLQVLPALSPLPLSLSLHLPLPIHPTRLCRLLTGALLQPRPKTASFSSQAVVREQRQRRTVPPQPTSRQHNATFGATPCSASPHLTWPPIGGC